MMIANREQHFFMLELFSTEKGFLLDLCNRETSNQVSYKKSNVITTIMHKGQRQSSELCNQTLKQNMCICRRSDAWENVDCLGVRAFFKPITKRSNTKPKQIRILVLDTQVKTTIMHGSLLTKFIDKTCHFNVGVV